MKRGLTFLAVLAIIQEKLNNPSPDDPYEPDIAAVRHYLAVISCY